MERGRKQFKEMVVDCSMHAVQRRGKHDHPGEISAPAERQALLWTTVDDSGFPRRLSDECSLEGAVCQNAETECYPFRNPQPSYIGLIFHL